MPREHSLPPDLTLDFRGQHVAVTAIPKHGYRFVTRVGPPINDEVRIYFTPDDDPLVWQDRVLAVLEALATRAEGELHLATQHSGPERNTPDDTDYATIFDTLILDLLKRYEEIRSRITTAHLDGDALSVFTSWVVSTNRAVGFGLTVRGQRYEGVHVSEEDVWKAIGMTAVMSTYQLSLDQLHDQANRFAQVP